MENNSEIIIYIATDGTTKLQVQLEDENVCLTQEQMSLLFAKKKTGRLLEGRKWDEMPVYSTSSSSV